MKKIKTKNEYLKIEKQLINSLLKKGYKLIDLKNEEDLILNFWKQIEKFNNIKLTIEEFERILIFLYEGDIKSKHYKLKSYYPLYKNESIYLIKFLDQKNINRNNFQITNSINLTEKDNLHFNLLINGIPFSHIELDKPNYSIFSLYNRVKKFKENTINASLFSFSQIFIISNTKNTKYILNDSNLKYNNLQSWKEGEWKNKNKASFKKVKKIEDFVNEFLEINQIRSFMSFYGDNIENDIFKIIKPKEVFYFKERNEQIKRLN